MTDYEVKRGVLRFDQLRAALPCPPLREHQHSDLPRSETQFTITDGRYYLWAFRCASDNESVFFTRYNTNEVDNIVRKIEDMFGVVIVGDDDPRYWDEESDAET